VPPVTRYAPSPTGALHIGGARTALFNWAFARRSGGRFLLRIEDTDRARSTRESEAAVLEAFEWLGIDWNPAGGERGFPRQSERLERYREAVERLLALGHAYRCVCTPEEVEAMREKARAEGRRPRYDGTCRDRKLGPDETRPFCVRVRIPEDARTRWEDGIAGPSGQDSAELDDFVIARTDGTPIYHLAVVIDDHEMGITDVIRGREHMTSTPRQLVLYEALDWKPPRFAHVPLLVEPGGKKLSKRHESASVQSYRDRGFAPEAVLNFIARLGWGHGDLEVFDRDEFAHLFSLAGVGHSPSQVHDDKLLWLNQQHIKRLPAEQLVHHVLPFLEREAGRPVRVDAPLERLLDLLRERTRTFEEMARLARFLLVDEVEPDEKSARKHLSAGAAKPLAELCSELERATEWKEPQLRAAFDTVVERCGLDGLGKLAQPVRVALTGGPVSPGIFETLEIIGRERSLARLRAGAERAAKSR
jgi:glutamyl-tRNA synthetase